MSESIEIVGKNFGILRDADGVEHVKLRDLCEPFGLSQSSQRERLSEQGWARVSKIDTRRTDGKRTAFACLPLKRVAMFFATLSPGHVNETFRPTLLAMQAEAADAVDAYYRLGGAVRETALPAQLVALRDQIDAILRPVPADDFIWPARFVRRYEAWQGRVWSPGDPQPFSMKNANGFFYSMVFPVEVLAVIKARGLEAGVRYHQVLADVPRDYLSRQLELAAALADDCGSEREWRTRMRRVYGKTPALKAGQRSLDL